MASIVGIWYKQTCPPNPSHGHHEQRIANIFPSEHDKRRQDTKKPRPCPPRILELKAWEGGRMW